MRIASSAIAVILAVALAACGAPPPPDPHPDLPSDRDLALFTTDSVLAATFAWARDTALSYARDRDDPVGPWYEAALPGRDAFCVRDVSHQAIGAHVLGLDAHTRNMVLAFARSQTDARDWTTFWEIDRLDRPAPVDYTDDTAFWYNLPANYDLLAAAWRLYRWTGDSTYVAHPDLVRFYDRVVRDYTERWDLGVDQVLGRDRFMNRSEFDLGDPHHLARGIPSYHEGAPGSTLVGVDLLALQVAAYRAYAGLLRTRAVNFGDPLDVAGHMEREADRVASLLDSVFWDPGPERYNDLLRTDGTVTRGGSMEAFVLAADAALGPDRTRGALRSLVTDPPANVEMQSYLPAILFRHGLDGMAYDLLIALGHPSTSRRDYPEVSFAVVEAAVSGLMGIEPVVDDFGTLVGVATRSRLPGHVASVTVTAVPVQSTMIDVRHDGLGGTTLANRGPEAVAWFARFSGAYEWIDVAGTEVAASRTGPIGGGEFSAVRVVVPPDSAVTVRALR